VSASTFSRSYATHYVGSVLDHLLCVKSAFVSGETLNDYAGIFVNQYTHSFIAARK